MTTFRRLAALVAAFTLTLAGALAFTATAASAAPAGCANTSLCGYVASDYKTVSGYEWLPPAPGTCENVGLRNQWSSVFNNSGRSVRLYKNTGCGNGVWTLASGDGLEAMSLFQPSWNDNIESIRW